MKRQQHTDIADSVGSTSRLTSDVDNNDSKLLLKFETPEPKDNYNIIYLVYFIYGFGTLMGFNGVLSTLEFFN